MSIKQEIAKKSHPIVAYGHSFSDERARDGYARMQKEKRDRAKARRAEMTPQNKSDAETRKFFAGEAKHFGIK
jgi:hypothetical protein